MGFGERQNAREILQIDANAYGAANIVLLHVFKNFRKAA